MPTRRPKVTAKKRPAPLRIAVCIDTRDHSGRERLHGMYEYALHQNWLLILVRQADPSALEQIAEMRADGAILFDRPRSFHEFMRARGIPCVEAGARNLELDDAAVFVDDTVIGSLAVDHLTAVGFEHLAYCGPSTATNPVSRQRAGSFRECARKLGRQISVFGETAGSGEAPLDPLARWLRRLPKPAGVLTYDDRFAEQILSACRLAGIPVPNQIGVVGIGDDELICELVHPRLTSVGMPTREIGRHAAECLDALIHDVALQRTRWPIPPTEVIVRGSTERLPTDDPFVVDAINFIRQSSHCPIGTEQIAAHLRVSRRTLERKFFRALGSSVHDFLTELRLRRAKQLLRRSRLPLSEVSRQCGYLALSTFKRMFSARAGCHPAEFRERHR